MEKDRGTVKMMLRQKKKKKGTTTIYTEFRRNIHDREGGTLLNFRFSLFPQVY